MANGVLVKRIKGIADDYDVVVDWRRKPRDKTGHPVFAWIFYDDHRIVVYRKNHTCFEDMVMTLGHEWVHAIKDDLPEYLIHEALDRVVFASPAVRWLAAQKLGNAACFKIR